MSNLATFPVRIRTQFELDQIAAAYRIAQDMADRMHITDSGYNVDPDYFPRMQRMLTRSIKINRYGADLVAELGIKQ